MYSMATGSNAEVQTTEAHRQGPCVVLCLPPAPQWAARRWLLMACTWLGPPVSARWSLLGVCFLHPLHGQSHFISGPMSGVTAPCACCKLKPLSGLPAQSRLCPPVSSPFLCLCLCREAQDDLAGFRPWRTGTAPAGGLWRNPRTRSTSHIRQSLDQQIPKDRHKPKLLIRRQIHQ